MGGGVLSLGSMGSAGASEPSLKWSRCGCEIDSYVNPHKLGVWNKF